MRLVWGGQQNTLLQHVDTLVNVTLLIKVTLARGFIKATLIQRAGICSISH